MKTVLDETTYDLKKSDNFREVARKTIGRHLARAEWNDAGTRLGLDPAPLHDMRVALRRMREAFRFFGPAFSERGAASLRRELQWLGSALGEVRDYDVYLHELDADARLLPETVRACLVDYANLIVSRRADARRKMLRALGSRRCARLFSRVRALVNDPGAYPWAGDETGTRPATDLGGEIVLRLLRGVEHAGDKLRESAPADAFHRMRIRCKRLRYGCEFLRTLYGQPVRLMIRKTIALQGVLGEHQDAVIAVQTLNEAVASRTVHPDPGWTPEHYYAVGRLVQLKMNLAKEKRSRFMADWKQFHRKPALKAFQKALIP